ncbi:MAG: hypothetical protein O3B65_05630 [Chloroflexi bacterium]|nr:hypothetical protein [Chloroflexota bacterium]
MSTLADRNPIPIGQADGSWNSIEENQKLVKELQDTIVQLRMQVYNLANRAAILKDEVARFELQIAKYREQERERPQKAWWKR